MASQGRWSATKVTVMATNLLLMLISQFMATQAAEYFTVGDAAGWTFHVENWTDGKSFKAGDFLIFKYDPSKHNVAQVDPFGLRTCTADSNSTIYTTGNDSIPLTEGSNNFICTFFGHCNAGMKIELTATAA